MNAARPRERPSFRVAGADSGSSGRPVGCTARGYHKLHHLTDILAIATCAVIGGAETWEAIAEYSCTKRAFFRRFLRLDNGIHSADTFGRVLDTLDPAAIAQAFGRWMAAACQATGLVPVTVDGQSARGRRGTRPRRACTW
jgi:hypothetical protein